MSSAPSDPVLRGRYRRIMRFATPVLIASWWYEIVLPRLGLARIADRARTRRLVAIARAYRPLASDLGGLMIKVGQFLSSRMDVLPPAAAAELASLQDEVHPVDFATMRAAAEESLGRPLSAVFATVDPVPLAAASLGQAHRATLHPDDARIAGFRDVVVKIQRPGIAEIVDTDLAALRRIAGLLARVKIVSARVDVPALVDEFAAVCREELDYVHEAANGSRFAENARAGVTAPATAWEISTDRVLVLEDVTAIKISDVAALRAAGVDVQRVATAFATTMFDQLFLDGFFHADPHPGNVFVTPKLNDDGFELTFIDFGMMGRISDELRAGLRRVMIAIAARDGASMVRAIDELGMLLPSADTAQLEAALRTLFDRFAGMSLGELQNVDPNELRDVATDFGDLVRTMPFQLPEDFLLVFRAVSLTSGVCSTLDADFNIWDAVDPYAAELVRGEGASALSVAGAEMMRTAGVLARLPRRVDDLVTKLDQGRLVVDTSALERRIDTIARRAISGILFAGLIISGAVVHATDAVLGSVLMVASIAPGGYSLVSLMRR